MNKGKNKVSSSISSILVYLLSLLFVAVLLVYLVTSSIKASDDSISSEIAMSDVDIVSISSKVANFAWKVERINDSITKYRIEASTSADDAGGSRFLTFAEFMNHLAEGNEYLITSFNEHFQQYEAVFFECAPVTKESFHSMTFEYVLIPAPSLERIQADMVPFQEHFSACSNKDVISFQNLGKDARLVVPCPISSENPSLIEDYNKNNAHLAKFIRYGNKDTIFTLWKTMASAVIDEMNDPSRSPDKRLWISTSGLGVYWLHIRLDSVPKYYNYNVYKHDKRAERA